jgi:hypothetical protein
MRRIDEILRRLARVTEGAVALEGGIGVQLTEEHLAVIRRGAGDGKRTGGREWNSGSSASH